MCAPVCGSPPSIHWPWLTVTHWLGHLCKASQVTTVWNSIKKKSHARDEKMIKSFIKPFPFSHSSLKQKKWTFLSTHCSGLNLLTWAGPYKFPLLLVFQVYVNIPIIIWFSWNVKLLACDICGISLTLCIPILSKDCQFLHPSILPPPQCNLLSLSSEYYLQSAYKTIQPVRCVITVAPLQDIPTSSLTLQHIRVLHVLRWTPLNCRLVAWLAYLCCWNYCLYRKGFPHH